MSIQVCALSLSSPYAFLPRLHTYCLVLLLLLPLPPGWLFRSALVTFTTRTVVTAIHSFIELKSSLADTKQGNPNPMPLDALAVVEMMALSSVVAVWSLLVPKRVGASRARALIRIWGVLVGTGTVTAFVVFEKVSASSEHAETVAYTVCGWMPLEYASVFGLDFKKFRNHVGISGLVFASLALLAAMLPDRGGKVEEVKRY
ncbi:hypothetical protein P152DRAFT_253796 [Eremomyces bilateralis CBS 781.70]|uniref:Uncharacterized protein n=1 Tax=Eremomyces bilateralis CBS 781.70 TaxID=1392243 RepID=A0A6G1FRC8_9PEZI|nr:uncharacterized protein P152DRAFT_253796 [Eremomyces bilateralis CBS 781.70]KAF1808222.1 hypothetical protein P152DRAFT_253796 [Eremomyces bilateralis CBS 781.70]